MLDRNLLACKFTASNEKKSLEDHERIETVAATSDDYKKIPKIQAKRTAFSASCMNFAPSGRQDTGLERVRTNVKRKHADSRLKKKLKEMKEALKEYLWYKTEKMTDQTAPHLRKI